MADRDRASAYRYAWWLTGDAERAAEVVAEAADRAGAADASAEDLLRAVRETAVEAPTMRARAELALLHDACDLPLGQAARVVGVSADDAPAALAQGRLDALDEPVAVVHAERLGGLAVASPGALAHTETCPSCAQLARRLLEGREALAGLGAAVPEPPAAPPPTAGEDDPAGDERETRDRGPAGGDATGDGEGEPHDDEPEDGSDEAGHGEAGPTDAGEAEPDDADAEHVRERATRVPIRIHVEDAAFATDEDDEDDEPAEPPSRRRLVTGALLAAATLAVVLAVALTAGDAGAAELAWTPRA